jgi:predicted PurR-regulated permease PerM
MSEPGSDLVRTVLQLLFIGALVAGSLWILRPFLMPLGWAAMIVVATWPLFRRLEIALGGRRGAAVATITVALLLALVAPLYVGISAIVRYADEIVGWSQALASAALPQPPAWLQQLPFVGERLAAEWRAMAAQSPDALATTVLPYARMLLTWFVGQVGSVGMLVVQFLLTVVIAAMLFARGEGVAEYVVRFARRVAGAQGESAVQLAAQAVRAVALGVVVTAAVQSAAGGLGLVIAGVPFASVLTAVMFVLGVAQVGAVPVLALSVVWVFLRESTAWGTFLLIWSVVVGTMDNFLRPILIRRGADLPLVLILAGVIGGLIALGVIGLFVGPMLLAVAHTLLVDWIGDDRA